LSREWDETWTPGLIRKDKLERGDVVVQGRSFREAYPDRPELWVLDPGVMDARLAAEGLNPDWGLRDIR
jgi:hypothetical protein